MVNGGRPNNFASNWTSVPTGGMWATPGYGLGATGDMWTGPGILGPGVLGATTYDVTRTPLVDVIETDNDILVTVELPGVRKEDIDVDVREYSIDVSVDAITEPTPEETIRFSRSERGAGGFYRTIALPLKVQPGQASAKYEDGLLKISIRKTDENRHQSSHIEVG